MTQGDAAIYILRSAFGVNWSQDIRIIFAGDDLTDEDAMKGLKGLAYSFRVVNSGLVHTLADHRCRKRVCFDKHMFVSLILTLSFRLRLPDTSAVQTMLLWLEQFMLRRRNK